jgi:hypothetical protein
VTPRNLNPVRVPQLTEERSVCMTRWLAARRIDELLWFVPAYGFFIV